MDLRTFFKRQEEKNEEEKNKEAKRKVKVGFMIHGTTKKGVAYVLWTNPLIAIGPYDYR